MLLYPYPHIIEYKKGVRGIKKEIKFEKNFRREEFIIEATEDGVFITARDEEALFRAETTLKQIEAQGATDCFMIHDYPDVEHRGVMLDISRSKIPSVKTVKKLIDMFADLKMNELQLYIEGYPFAYSHYPQVWKNTTPLTPDDIRDIDAYCKEHFIEFIPNQNCFGHMSP